MLTFDDLNRIHVSLLQYGNKYKGELGTITSLLSLPTSLNETLEHFNNDFSWEPLCVYLAHLSVLKCVFKTIEFLDLKQKQLLERQLLSPILIKSLSCLASASHVVVRTSANHSIVMLLKTVCENKNFVKKTLCTILSMEPGLNTSMYLIDAKTALVTLLLTEEHKLLATEYSVSTLVQNFSHLEVNKEDNLAFLSYLSALSATCKLYPEKKHLLIETHCAVLGDFSACFGRPVGCLAYLKLLLDLLPFPNSSKDSEVASTKPFCQYLSKSICDYGRIMGEVPQARNNVSKCSDKILAAMVINSLLRCTVTLYSDDENLDLRSVEHCIRQLLPQNKGSVQERFLEACFEQDELLVEILILHLTISTFLRQNSRDDFLFNHHVLFIELLQRLSFDSSILLDWLTSNETRFLFYILKYAKFVLHCKGELLRICKSKDASFAFQILNMLLQLKQSINSLQMSGLFPYNHKPLIRNLDHLVVALNFE